MGDSWERSVGQSDGYDLFVLKLTNNAITGDKPKIFITGSIHAREYTAAELATRYAEYLIANYNVNPDITWLLDYHEIHLMLQMNPYGRKEAEAGRSWRKNTNENYCGVISTSRGADLNRKYSFYWNYCYGCSSGSPCDTMYRGPSPASEPEVSAVQAYMRSIFPDQRDAALSEVITRAENKGAVASWSPTGASVADGHDIINRAFFDAIFMDGVANIGEATQQSLLDLWATGTHLHLVDTFLLFGDPSTFIVRELTAVSDNYSMEENAELNVSAIDGVLINDINPDGLLLEAELVSEPAHGILILHPDGSFTHTPTLTWFGLDSFTYRAVSGNIQSNTATVTIDIKSTNHAPVANPDSYTTLEGIPLIIPAQFGLLANDTDDDTGDPMIAYVYSIPALGSLVFQEDGSFTYIPNSNVTGTDTFTYRAYDGEAFSEIANVTINLNAITQQIFAPIVIK